jgi:sulfoxide reductase heme-binding subunit YedZ
MASRWIRVVGAPPTLWLLLAAPAAWMSARYLTGASAYGEFIHESGDVAVKLLIVTLAVTPLRLLFPSARWPAWLLRRRRDLGVATFAYAMLHTAAYLERKASASLVFQEAAEPGLWTGWAAAAIFAALAITSNNASVRALGRSWKRLHRLVYLGAALTFAHWILTAFDPVPAFAHLGALLLLQALRVALVRRRARAS